MGYEKQNTLGQEAKQTALKDFPIGTAMEAIPGAAKNVLESQTAKRFGKGVADLSSVLPGVESRSVSNLFKNPRNILPEFLGGPAPLKESGEAIGKIESRLGIPGLSEREGSQVLKVKSPTGMSEGTVKVYNPNTDFNIESLQKAAKNFDPKRKAEMEKAIEAIKGSLGKTSTESDRQISARVYDEMKQGKTHDLKDTVQAIRGVDNRLQTMGSDPTTEEFQNKFLLTTFRKKLVKNLSEMMPELQKAKSEYARGMTRADFVSPGFGLASKDAGGGISKMGVGRTFGPFALGRMMNQPAFGALMGASQSPAVLGGVTAGAGALAQAAQSRLTPYAIKSLLETIRRKNKASQEQTGQ